VNGWLLTLPICSNLLYDHIVRVNVIKKIKNFDRKKFFLINIIKELFFKIKYDKLHFGSNKSDNRLGLN